MPADVVEVTAVRECRRAEDGQRKGSCSDLGLIGTFGDCLDLDLTGTF